MLSENDDARPETAMHDMDSPADPGQGANQPGDNRDSSSGHVQCSVCSSIFRRPEHLKRHLRSHTKEKPFECAQCGRHFSRTDTLHRHELSHHTTGSEGGKDRTHRITVKTFRACFSCATARVRCSGGTPCGRCDIRSLECQYPTERRSRGKVRNGSSKRLSGLDMLEHEPQTPLPSSNRLNGDEAESMEIEHASSSQMAKFSVNNIHGATSPNASVNAFSIRMDTHAESTPSDGRAPIVGASNSPLYLPSSNQLLPSTRLPSAVYPNDNSQHPHNDMATPDVPKIFSVDSTSGLGPNRRNIQPDMTNSGADIEMNISGDAQMTLEFDPSLFDQSMLSTINWLPNELFASASNGQTQLSGVPLQQTQSAVSVSYPTGMAWHPPVTNTEQISPSIAENFSHAPSGHISLGTDMGSPRRYSNVGSEASPHSESVDSSKRSSEYYVDGGGARLPSYRKKHVPWPNAVEAMALSGQSIAEDNVHRHGFPSTHEISLNDISEVAKSVRPIDTSTHQELYRNFLLLCRTENPYFEVFESDYFPTAENCTGYLASYFDSFHDVYPIIHLPTFDLNRCHWLLVLAIMAIGCRTSSIYEADQCSNAFHEMIRRALYVEKEKSDMERVSLHLMQAMLLNCIGLLHSGSEQNKLSALKMFKDLVTFASREKLLSSSRTDLSNTSDEVMWIKWAQDETRRRTGYCIWLLDCTLAYYFEDRPLLSLNDGQASLPVHEKLWQISSAEAWKHRWDNTTVNDSLNDTVHILYIEKKLVSGIGEFSHILLIHALYHRMWEVGDYFRRPLSFWNPTAKRQSRETAIPTGSVWLPGIPSYSKWRNSTCDCLDILHWAANSTVAKAAGMEHPTILHLHAARLVLLAPFREVRSLATSLATDQLRWNKRHQAIEWQYIWRWVKHDQYKARLSIIHAGAILWHVRRYSTNAFHVPVAVFLAVLTLWAYGSCHAHATQGSIPHLQMSGIELLEEPSFVHLDRPCDDELVQLFVREGHSMRGNVTGVGDICAPEGPERILRVGCEMLSSLAAWGISKRFIAILTRLADVMARQPRTEHNRDVSMGGS